MPNPQLLTLIPEKLAKNWQIEKTEPPKKQKRQGN